MKTEAKLFPGTVLLYYPVFGDYKVFLTGGRNVATAWIRGTINGQHNFTREEFLALKTEKIARALYAYRGENDHAR